MNQTAVQNCVHHWVIEGPDRPESLGECIRCGATKSFQNVPARLPFDRSMSPIAQEFRASTRSTGREQVRLSDE